MSSITIVSGWTDAGGEGVGDQGAQLLGALDGIGTDSGTRRRPEGDGQLGRHLGQPDPELADKASGELEAVAFVPTRQPDPREVVGPSIAQPSSCHSRLRPTRR